MSAGEAFGEIALVSNEKRLGFIFLIHRTATVFVRENTEFATINRAGF
jgi:CRP-like cAMP-binding protein